MKLSKIPKHIWWGVALPVVLVGLGIWRLAPVIEYYRAEDERTARVRLLISMARVINASQRARAQENDYPRVTVKVCATNLLTGNPTLYHGYYVDGLCAYPERYDWRHKYTFIISEDATIYAVDNGGEPITEWPTDEDLAKRFNKVDLD